MKTGGASKRKWEQITGVMMLHWIIRETALEYITVFLGSDL